MLGEPYIESGNVTETAKGNGHSRRIKVLEEVGGGECDRLKIIA
jgi:hypothetical protein